MSLEVTSGYRPRGEEVAERPLRVHSLIHTLIYLLYPYCPGTYQELVTQHCTKAIKSLPLWSCPPSETKGTQVNQRDTSDALGRCVRGRVAGGGRGQHVQRPGGGTWKPLALRAPSSPE